MQRVTPNNGEYGNPKIQKYKKLLRNPPKIRHGKPKIQIQNTKIQNTEQQKILLFFEIDLFFTS